MKHTINLYQPSLRPITRTLTPQRLGVALLCIMVLMVGWRVAIEIGSQSVRAQLRAESERYQQLQSRLTELSTQAQAQRLDQALVRRVERLENEVNARRSLLQEFSSRALVSQVDFSNVLGDLAEAHVEGIWLTRIRADESGVEIYGKTVQPAVIPNWISGFSQVETLKAFQFSVVALQRDNQNVLNFGIVSRTRPSRDVEPLDMPADVQEETP